MAHALVHTQGVVLGKTYIPLELAYWDCLGESVHLLITSPLNYSKMKRLYPKARPDVLVTTVEGVPYSRVLDYLKWRFEVLSNAFPSIPILFGHKGNSYQPRVLLDAGIPNRINVETLGVPALQVSNTDTCHWHKGNPRRKCARAALEQILNHAR